VQAVELGEQCVLVRAHVAVVGGQHVEQGVHLRLAHGLDEEAVVVREVEHGAALARGGQLAQRVAAGEGHHVLRRVCGKQVAQVPAHTGEAGGMRAVHLNSRTMLQRVEKIQMLQGHRIGML
jgi:hypothetical protein